MTFRCELHMTREISKQASISTSRRHVKSGLADQLVLICTSACQHISAGAAGGHQHHPPASCNYDGSPFVVVLSGGSAPIVRLPIVVQPDCHKGEREIEKVSHRKQKKLFVPN